MYITLRTSASYVHSYITQIVHSHKYMSTIISKPAVNIDNKPCTMLSLCTDLNQQLRDIIFKQIDRFWILFTNTGDDF